MQESLLFLCKKVCVQTNYILGEFSFMESVRCICIANTLNFENSARKKNRTGALLVYSTIFSYFYYVQWLITQRSRVLLPRCLHVPYFATIIITPSYDFTSTATIVHSFADCHNQENAYLSRKYYPTQSSGTYMSLKQICNWKILRSWWVQG